MKNNESMNYKLFDMSAMADAMLESTSIDFYQYINTMTEEQMDNSIANADEIYEYIINDETYMVQLDNEDNESDTDDEIANSEYEKFEYYDEENVSEVIVDFDPNVEKNVNLVFVKTNRNARKLVYDGYTYVLDRENDEISQWKCSFSVCVGVEEINGKKKYKYKYCPGRCHTLSDKDFKMVTNHESTFHLPDPVAVECLVVEDKIKNLAKTTQD
jgi:hypothetical protein